VQATPGISGGPAGRVSDPASATASAGATATATAGASASATATATATIAADLYALVVHLHKNCNSDLFEAVGAIDLSLTQIKLLHHLEGSERELTLKEAAELVHVSLPAASRMVDELVRRGFVERREDQIDRRMKRVTVTDAGRAVIRRLNAARLAGLEQFSASMTDAERDALAPALTELLNRPDIAACRPDGAER
jgi:DNA-binding MarR family transcriptional regulator